MLPISIWTRLGIYGVCLGMIFLGALRLYDNGFNAGVNDSQVKIDKANADAAKAQADLQARSDLRAELENSGLGKQMQALQGKVGKLLTSGIPQYSKSLPSDCIYDDERVKDANAE